MSFSTAVLAKPKVACISTCVAIETEAVVETDTDTDDLLSSDDHSDCRSKFSLRSFSEMKDISKSSIIPQDLYKHPPSVVELDKGAQQTSDDSVIKRLTMGRMAVFDSNQNATSTTARRPNGKYYMCPSNTFIASNGDVYEIEPFMLPPPTEIAALFKELKHRRDRSDSLVSVDVDATSVRQEKLRDSKSSKESSDELLIKSRVALNDEQQSLPRVTSFDSVCTDASMTADEEKEVLPSTNRQLEDSQKYRQKAVRVSLESNDAPDDNISEDSRSPRACAKEQLRQRSKYSDDSGSKKANQPESSIGAYPSFLRTDQPGRRSRDEETFDWEKFSLQKYLMTEMLGIGEAGHLLPAAVGHMENFLTVPSKVEAFVGFGFFICFDAFLNVITFLPIRVVYSSGLLLCEMLGFIIGLISIFEIPLFHTLRKKMKIKLKGYFHKSHLYDLMRGTFVVLSCYFLLRLNMSRVYHYVRGQTLIKLYVLTAMLEIFDKLLCSFGQDAFDSLYCITRMRPDPRKILYAFIITAVYTILHSSLYFMLIATLTVAINSADSALVTVLVLNNFGEIKSFVFKKFDNQNLFQLSCSDVTERFQLVLFLVCISGVALAQAGSSWLEIFPTHIGVMALMLTSEAVADWIKHAFISKFNHINANVYDDFSRVLRKDILNCHKDKVILDQTYAITKRVGLAQIPLCCVFLRYLILALSAPEIQTYLGYQSRLHLLLLSLSWFGALVLCKIAIGLGLVRYAAIIHNAELLLRADEERINLNGSTRFVNKMSMKQLSNIERFTSYKGRVVG